MSTIAHATVEHQIRDRIYRTRPYHPRHLLDLAVYLVLQGYSDGSRAAIMSHVEAGHCLDYLVTANLLEPADLAGASDALESGQSWLKARTLSTLITVDDEPFLPPPDDDPFDEVLELDAQLDAQDDDRLDRRLAELTLEFACLPEPGHYEPTADDLRDYGEWSESLDFHAAVRDHHEALQVYLTFYPE